jgi:putative transcriptional regulator
MSKFGTRLIQAAKEAAAIARGDVAPARIHVPADIDVKAVRQKLALGQDAFASEFGFSINQIRDWEQQRTRPLGAMRAYLMIIDRDPEGVRELLKRTPVAMKNRARKAA